MGPDIYIILLILITLITVFLVGHLGWLFYKNTTPKILLRKLQYYSSIILFLILGGVFFELILMTLFDSSYFDLFEKIAWGSFQWKPTFVYKWMLVHRVIVIVLLLLSLHLVLSKRKHISIIISHIKQIRAVLFQRHNHSISSPSIGIKSFAVLGLVIGSFCLVSFLVKFSNNIALFDVESWSYRTGFHSYNFYQIVDSLKLLLAGCLFIVTAIRLLYLKPDAWWISIIALAVYEAMSLWSTLYYFQTPTYGGFFNVIIGLLFCIGFAALMTLFWRNKTAYNVSKTKS